MTTLIALLSSGKGTWGHVNSLIQVAQWNKIILFCNEFAYKEFDVKNKEVLKLQIDEKKPQEYIDKIAETLHKEVDDLEVALNMVSGNGYEHMIIVGGIIKAGLGFRLVACEHKELITYKLYETPELLGEEDNPYDQ
ncbi:MAG: hypothetical protein ACLFPL_04670 [Candidatus Nanoarchaeia archaeon]